MEGQLPPLLVQVLYVLGPSAVGKSYITDASAAQLFSSRDSAVTHRTAHRTVHPSPLHAYYTHNQTELDRIKPELEPDPIPTQTIHLHIASSPRIFEVITHCVLR